ncbi:hypothetical protein ACQLT9_005991, partial [Salmonella enterica subsp. diarizonae]
NPTKRVSIGNIGTDMFDGRQPCINIGDSDSGFIGSADGVLDIYCNNAKVGYIDNAGLHMLADIFTAGSLHAGDATLHTDGNVNGSVWGGWLNDWINNNLVRAVRLGPVALSGGLWRDFQLGGGQVVTGFHTDGDWEMQGGDDKVYYRPIQYLIGTQWVTAPSA